MPVCLKDFTPQQAEIFLESLAFMLQQDKNAPIEKTQFIKIQAIKLQHPLKGLKFKTNKCATEIAVLLNKIDNIIIKRYILLQMIMLTIAAHELQDKEVDVIYDIGTKAGISIDKIDDFFLWAAKGVEWQIEGMKIVEEDL